MTRAGFISGIGALMCDTHTPEREQKRVKSFMDDSLPLSIHLYVLLCVAHVTRAGFVSDIGALMCDTHTLTREQKRVKSFMDEDWR